MPDEKRSSGLQRQIGLSSAISLNMMNMIGVGPFITLPLVVIAMGGPQAILGWVLGAVIAICDGLVWAELGAAMPEAGGSYAFLREIYGREGAGKLVSFLYIWQLGFTAPLSIASGCIGLAQYAAYLWPRLNASVRIAGWNLHATSLVAAVSCLFAVLLLYRNLSSITRIAWAMTGGVLLTIGATIVAGATHFHPEYLKISAGAFAATPVFFKGLGAATLLATYDYWGYYAVCFLGGEVRKPEKTIPRAVLLSIVVVAVLYLCMNVSVLGVIPMQEIMHSGNAKFAVVATLMDRTMGATAAKVLSLLVMWTAFASVFSLLLAYSRAPYAAAVDGNYFRIFSRLHPKHQFPTVSLVALGVVATVFCFFDLSSVIAALVAIRIVLQYVLQQVGVMLLRARRPDMPRPFRIWLYPVPPLLALAGFFFIVFSRPHASRELIFALIVAVAGTVLYLLRAFRRREWPFGVDSQR